MEINRLFDGCQQWLYRVKKSKIKSFKRKYRNRQEVIIGFLFSLKSLEYFTVYGFTDESCRKTSKVESCYVESYTMRHRTCWQTRWIKSVCRGEIHPSGFRYCWARKAASTLPLYWLTDGSKCPVGVAMEAEQLETQRHNILVSAGIELIFLSVAAVFWI